MRSRPRRTIVCDEERRAVEDTSGVASPSPVRAGDREAALQDATCEEGSKPSLTWPGVSRSRADKHGEASYRTPLTHLFQMGAQRKATRGVRDNIAWGKSDATSGRRDGGWSQIECATRPLGGVDRLTRSREVALKRGHRQEWVTRLKVAGQPRSRGCERPRVCSWIVMIGRSRWAAWGPRISRRRRRAARGPSAIRIA